MGRYVGNPGASWWDYVTGPGRLVSEAVDALRDGKNVCVFVRDKIPFRKMFFQRVAGALRESADSLVLAETIENEGEPGMCLVRRCGLLADYRKTESPEALLKRLRALSNRLQPVVAGENAARQWLKFIRNYRPDSVEDGGAFLAELAPDSPMPANPGRNMFFMKYADYVSEYDALFFASMMAQDSQFGVAAKRYMTALATSLFGRDAESAAEFVRGYPDDHGIDSWSQMFGADEWTRKIWNAQVQELFPLIMRETRRLVETWGAEFASAAEYAELSRGYENSLFPNGLANSTGEPVESVYELEISAIVYMMRKRRRDEQGNEESDYVLYIPDEAARERAALLYRSRNLIAHGKVCPAESLAPLLGGNSEP